MVYINQYRKRLRMDTSLENVLLQQNRNIFNKIMKIIKKM